MVVRDSIGFPELGSHANPVVIGDGLAPFGSASSFIVIHLDDDLCYDKVDRCGSQADTELMATPEFWEALIDESFSVPADKCGAVCSSFVRAPTRSPAHDNAETLHSFGQSSANSFLLDDKALKVTESSFNGQQDCSSLETIMHKARERCNWLSK